MKEVLVGVVYSLSLIYSLFHPEIILGCSFTSFTAWQEDSSSYWWDFSVRDGLKIGYPNKGPEAAAFLPASQP